MSFITAEKVLEQSIKLGLLKDSTTFAADIELLVMLVELEILSWLGWNPVRSEYRETMKTTTAGACLTTAYPIIELVSITPKNQDFGLFPTPVKYAWSGSLRTIATGIPSEFVEIIYIAGLDPLPQIFSIVALSVCIKAIEEGFFESRNIDFLNEPINEVKALSLPGGLSTTFNTSDYALSGGDSGLGLRLVDKLLNPLSSYKRSIKT